MYHNTVVALTAGEAATPTTFGTVVGAIIILYIMVGLIALGLSFAMDDEVPGPPPTPPNGWQVVTDLSFCIVAWPLILADVLRSRRDAKDR